VKNMTGKIPAQLKTFLDLVENTSEDECDCDEVYRLMDEAAEIIAAGGDLSIVMPRVEHHLRVCTCCDAEFEVLKQILAANGSDQ
jgi:hypothetical protein